jgi:signal transduction histidine kinase/ligand-binding sensor domain-containing protein
MRTPRRLVMKTGIAPHARAHTLHRGPLMPRPGSRPLIPAALRRAVCVLSLLGACLPSLAETTEFHPQMWRTDEGLPHNTVARIAQDRAGFLWLGTSGGLARFDGREFKEFKLPLSYLSGGYNIRGLAVEPSGALLVIPPAIAVLRFSDGQFSEHPVTESLRSRNDAPSDLFVEKGGALWVGTFNRQLARWSPETGPQYLTEEGTVPSRTKKFTFATSEMGETWIASDDFLSVFREGRLVPHPQRPAGPILIAQSTSGRIWVCTADALMILERGRLRVETTDIPWRDAFGAVRHVHEDSTGALWIIRSRGGLLRYVGQRFEAVGSPFSSASFAMEDREGSIWIGTDGDGVGRLRAKSHRIVDASSGLAENAVSAIWHDANGQMWLSNRSGGPVAVLPDGTLRRAFVSAGSRVFTNAAVTDHDGQLWFGGGRDGLYRGDPAGSTWEKMPVPTRDLHLLQTVSNGDVWFAAGQGEFGYYRGSEVRHLSTETVIPNVGLRAMAEDPKGIVWLGSHGGHLMRWDGKTLERVSLGAEIPDQPIHDLHADGPGELWIATVGGLVRHEGGRSRLFTEAEGLADTLIMQVAEDNFGRLWFAARRGIFCVTKSELRAVFRGEAKRVTSRMFGRDQGLTGISPIANYHPRKAKSADGRLWFATSQGAVVVDPSKVARDLPPAPVLVDEVRFNGRVLGKDEPARLPSGRHRIEFQFVAPTFFSPENVEVQHRLEGVDADWVDAGSDRAASYTNLPPGPYKLRVAARHKTGEWRADSPVFTFTIVPAWWETGWFRVFSVVVFTALTAWLVRAISQRVLKRRLERLEQEHALEKERARIARDLHDDLGSGLTELGLLAERIAGAPPGDSARLVNGLASRTRRLAAELSGIVWTMNGSNGRLDQLASFVGQYAQRLFRHTGPTCVIRGVETIPSIPLAPDPQHQVLATTKEALNNIVKHAHATQAELVMSWEAGVFELSIRDNGTGFDVSAATVAADGNGLRNMRSRLAEVGGSLNIESAPGGGTTVTLRMPCSGPIEKASSPKPL